MTEQEAQPAEEKKEELKEKLGTLGKVEEIVNQYAKTIASKEGIGEDKFKVHLLTKMNGIVGLKRGPVVQIFLLWPDAQPNINTLLRDSFRAIKKNGLIDGLNIELAAHIRSRNIQNRKWLKEKFGEEADLFMDLIPKERLVVSRTETITVMDNVTKEKITITQEHPPEHYRRPNIDLWLQLSRIVRDNHKEEIEDGIERGDQAATPETDGE